MDDHLGFKCSWRDGWIMYNDTIVVLYQKPGLNGDAYYIHKANYGLNIQVYPTIIHYTFLILSFAYLF